MKLHSKLSQFWNSDFWTLTSDLRPIYAYASLVLWRASLQTVGCFQHHLSSCFLSPLQLLLLLMRTMAEVEVTMRTSAGVAVVIQMSDLLTVLTASSVQRWGKLFDVIKVTSTFHRLAYFPHGGKKIWWLWIAVGRGFLQTSSSPNSLKTWKLLGWTTHGPLNSGRIAYFSTSTSFAIRTESRDNFGIGTNTTKTVSLAPSSWKPDRLCFGKQLQLNICIDVSKGNQKGTFCEVVDYTRVNLMTQSLGVRWASGLQWTETAFPSLFTSQLLRGQLGSLWCQGGSSSSWRRGDLSIQVHLARWATSLQDGCRGHCEDQEGPQQKDDRHCGNGSTIFLDWL